VEEHDLLSAKEVAQYLRLSERTILAWAQKGQIPAVRLGKSWRFPRGEVEDWLRRKSAARPAAGAGEGVSLEKALSPERVLILPGRRRKEEVLMSLVDCLARSPAVKDRDELARAIFQRESLMSTGMGLGVGVPHVRLTSVTDLVMAAASCPDGIEGYDSMDGEPVRLVFMIAAQRDAHANYIRLLSLLSRRLKDPEMRRRLLGVEDPSEFYQVLVGQVPVSSSRGG